MRPLTLDTIDAREQNAPLAELSRAGFELFQSLPMPTAQQEEWRYVDLDFTLDDLALAEGPGEALTSDSFVVGEPHATILDGFVTGTRPEGEVNVSRLSETDPEVLKLAAEAAVPMDLDRFSAAHYAFGVDGVVVAGGKGVVAEHPVVLDVQAVTPGTLALPRISVVAEANSDVSVVVVYRSPDEGSFHVVPHVQIAVGDGARVRISTVQAWGYGTVAVAQQRAVIGRDARLHHGEAGIGARLGRLHFFVDLDGRGAHSEITGLYFGEDDQVLDYRGFISHSAPHTTSNMFLKGAVEDQSHSVFTGLIRIEEEAQKVDAYQTNRNLVLSDEAGAESVPNLEILANDVRCGHGSTVGPLDADQRYYLMSRGLDRIHADRLQVRGFFEEAIEQLPHPELAEPIRLAVNAKYVRAQEEGRV